MGVETKLFLAISHNPRQLTAAIYSASYVWVERMCAPQALLHPQHQAGAEGGWLLHMGWPY